MSKSTITVDQILSAYPGLVEWLDGARDAHVEAPCSQVHPVAGGLVFVADPDNLEKLLKSDVSVIVAHQKLSALAKSKNSARKCLLVSKNTYLAMAVINARFFSLPFKRQPLQNAGVAQISSKARIGHNAIIGPGAVICDDVEIGDHTYIGANCVIEPRTRIGDDCYIHPQVFIGHTCQIGNRVEIKPFSTIGTDGFGYAHDDKGNHYRIPHYGPVIIEDDVHIGANVNIDRGTFDSARIGYGTKIDNHCHFGHNVQIGKNCLITAGMIVAGSTKIGDNCIFGGRTSVSGHIEIVSGCTFGPISGITNDVTKPGVYSGYPIEPFRQFLKSRASIPQLPRIRKNLARVMKHLGLKEEHPHSNENNPS
jgi:UDP-3-O-[3-hydroxymyristoyl] glucosamine N-acyltransferase